MIYKRLVLGAFFLTSLLPVIASAAVQSINSTPASFNDVAVGDTVEFTIDYPTSNPDSPGLGFKIYYDSSKLTPVLTASNPSIIPSGLKDINAPKFTGVQTLPDNGNDDSDPDTDQRFIIAWAATSQLDPIWNPSGEDLVTVTFTTSANFTTDTTINFTGTPAAGNTFSASSVNVKVPVVQPPADTEDPDVTAPADIAIEATGAATTVNLGSATVTDNVDASLTAVASSLGPFSLGSHTIIWTATDAAGNTGTDTQTITVNDTTPPVITAPDKTVQTTGATTQVNLGASASDLVDGAITPTTSDSTGPFAVGTHTVTWAAVDAQGNSSTKDQTVTVTATPQDTTPPVITIPPTTTATEIRLEAGKTKISRDDLESQSGVSATDDSGGLVSFVVIDVQDADLRDFLTAGTYDILWRATDPSGNSSTATQRIIILAAAPPLAVPTLSEWGIILLSLMLMLVSWVGFGRNKEI